MNARIENEVIKHFLGYKTRIVGSIANQNHNYTRKEVWFCKIRVISPNTFVVGQIKNRYDLAFVSVTIELYTFLQNRISEPLNNLLLFAPRLTEYSLYKQPVLNTLGYAFNTNKKSSRIISATIVGSDIYITTADAIVTPLPPKFIDVIIYDARYPNIITDLPVGFSYASAGGTVSANLHNPDGSFDIKAISGATQYDYFTYNNGITSITTALYPIYDKETVARNVYKYRYFL